MGTFMAAKKKSERMKPLRLPMKFDEAVSDLLKVKPPKKDKSNVKRKNSSTALRKKRLR